MLIEQNWRTERVPNISQHLIERAHRRYGLATTDPKVAEAWGALAESAYKLDLWGMDSGGTTHIPGTNYNNYAWVRAMQNSTELHRQALTLLCVHCLFRRRTLLQSLASISTARPTTGSPSAPLAPCARSSRPGGH